MNATSFKFGINQFSDMNEHEFLSVYGKGLLGSTDDEQQEYKEFDENGRYICRHDDELHNYFDYQDYEYIDTKLKTCGNAIDWVAKGKVGAPKQQSTCGSCWAHSTIASIETLHAINQNISGNVTSFSEQ